jgi:hypothetical protein
MLLEQVQQSALHTARMPLRAWNAGADVYVYKELQKQVMNQ